MADGKLFILALLAALAVSPAVDAEVKHEQTSNYQIVRLTDAGAKPQIVKLDDLENGVFFLNDTAATALKLEVAFGAHPAHCASPLMKMHEDGVYRSSAPLEPNQFSSVCFPFAGSYPFRAVAAAGSRELSGQIVVERK